MYRMAMPWIYRAPSLQPFALAHNFMAALEQVVEVVTNPIWSARIRTANFKYGRVD